jgi:diguanylate cyclase (GGDEF)-like protein
MENNILIIEDQLDNFTQLNTILLEGKYRVRQATNLEEALQLIQENCPDVVIINLETFELNRQLMLKFLNLSSIVDHIPLIFIGTLTQILELDLPFSDYMNQPFVPDDILLRVKNQLTISQQRKQLLETNLLLEQEIKKRQEAEFEITKIYQQLEHLATLDPLTQVGNRNLFDEYLLKEWRRGIRDKLPLSLILCDLDYFRKYNDLYGYQAGDQCLLRIAQAIVRSINRPADLIARYGGEKFGLILPNTKYEGAVKIAQTIKVSVRQLKISFPQSSVREYLTLSIGISSLIPNQELSQNTLFQYAEKALAVAKDRGRDCIILTDASGTQVSLPDSGFH